MREREREKVQSKRNGGKGTEERDGEGMVVIVSLTSF